MTTRSILVIEDEASLRESMVYALNHLGHETAAVGDGNAALHYLAAMRTPGLFLVDLVIPGEDGWYLVNQIRAHGLAHGFSHKIMVVSGLHNGQSIAHLEAIGFLAKPFSIDRLMEVVTAVLSREDVLNDPSQAA